jgi:cytochrome c oxidase assembly protein subunit 15
LGALAGIACIITFILSFYRKEKQKTTTTLFVFVLMGFQAWLGKTVVDSVLNPFNNHSHAGCIINCSASIDCYLYRKKNITKHLFSIKSLIDISWLIRSNHHSNVLGTTVREHVDIVSETGSEIMWLQNPTIAFYIHRFFNNSTN